MSEVDARPVPSRGRSSTRGGRGGYGRSGPRGGYKHANGTHRDAPQEVVNRVEDSLEDQGELGEMKKKYAAELAQLKEMFPDWTDVDLVFALQETDGDMMSTIDHITQGNVTQFSEIKKKTKDRARSKVKDEPAAAGASDKPVSSFRGGRGRGGFEGTRGGRGRGSDRGRGGFRGGRGGHATTNGTATDATVASVPTTESSAWDTPPAAAETGVDNAWDTSAAEPAATEAKDGGQSSWGNVLTSEATPAAASEGAKSSLIPEGGAKKSWASMFSAPKPAPAPPKQATVPPPKPAEVAAQEEPPMVEQKAMLDEAKAPEPLLPPPTVQEPEIEEIDSAVVEPDVMEPLSATDGEDLQLTPSKDPLTEDNLEHLPDVSHPPATLTAVSTTGSIDPRNLTPLPGQQPPIGRPPIGGYAASAYRAAGVPGRSASYQRRVQEQQEAVVMPGHNTVDRAAVQFGSMGLNGDASGLDVDDDREEPETRTQPPQQSPPSQPRASLPPAPRQPSLPSEQAVPEGLPTPKPAPGLPPASQQHQQQLQDSSTMPAIGQGMPQEQQPSQLNQYNQYGRYAQSGMQGEAAAQHQKAYDPFSHQAQPNQYEQYAQQHQGAHQQPPQQQQQPSQQSGFGGMSSAPNDYSQYYTSDQNRNAYQHYYGNAYGQQDTSGAPQQRSASGFGADNFPSQSQQQQDPQSRYSAAPGSGHNTPNPPMGAQQQSGGPGSHQQQHQMGQHPSQQQQSGYGGYPYGHPYYNSPYPSAYQNQYGFNQPVGGYGGGYPGKQQGMYAQPHGYGGIGPQSSYDQHSSSPANASAFGQNQQTSMRSTSGMGAGLGGGLDDYGRSSAQPSHQQSSGGFGGAGMNDPFARPLTGFGGQQSGGYGGQQSMPSGPDDSLKPFGDSKAGGPSPGLGQPGRPGSAANSAAGAGQSGLPPPQSHQSGFGGGYPGFPSSQGSQYSGLGGLGNHQQGQQQQSGYGGYGAGAFGQYGSYGRGGWGQSYGH